MIIVSDTSPLNYLAMLGRLSLLPSLFERVVIPEEVAAELQRGRAHVAELREVLSAPWIEVRAVSHAEPLGALVKLLDRGEAEAIALAVEARILLILMEERDGRSAAQACGLSPIGVAGLLVRAKARGLVPEVRRDLDWLLTHTSYRLNTAIYRDALRLAGETP